MTIRISGKTMPEVTGALKDSKFFAGADGAQTAETLHSAAQTVPTPSSAARASGFHRFESSEQWQKEIAGTNKPSTGTGTGYSRPRYYTDGHASTFDNIAPPSQVNAREAGSNSYYIKQAIKEQSDLKAAQANPQPGPTQIKTDIGKGPSTISTPRM